jgi:hypothetical protein
MTEIVLVNAAKEKILKHAIEHAKEYGFEIVGWLVGFFENDDVYVMDAIPATQYISQSKYGAEASPVEEMNLAMSYPRKIGIVGLYHSHPFREDYLEATMGKGDTPMFHSEIDDYMLSSRASKKKSYLSIVTDGYAIGCFLYSPSGSTQVRPSVVEKYDYKNKLIEYFTKLKFVIKKEEPMSIRETIIWARECIVERLENIFMREIKDIEIYIDEVNKKAEIFLSYPVEETIKENLFNIQLEKELVTSASVTFNITPTVFSHKNTSALEILNLLKDESIDRCLNLFSKVDVEKIMREVRRGCRVVDVRFGDLTIDYTGALPRMKYIPPQRPIFGRKN